MADATEAGTTTAATWRESGWRATVERMRQWVRGELPCEDCNGARVRRGNPCSECDGTGHMLVSDRWVPDSAQLREGASTLADLIADYDVRGGEEKLPARSQAFIAELRAGLGDALFEIIKRVDELADDMTAEDK